MFPFVELMVWDCPLAMAVDVPPQFTPFADQLTDFAAQVAAGVGVAHVAVPLFIHVPLLHTTG